MASRAILVELVTCLSLDDILLAFTRFTDLREQVNTIYSDNASAFQAGSKKLPDLIESKDFHTSFKRRYKLGIMPSYAPAQGSAWEAMVKQFKIVLSHILDTTVHETKFLKC